MLSVVPCRLQKYTVLRAEPEEEEADRQLSVDVLVGLSSEPKQLPSRLFYDDEGSRLFQKICSLEDYYLSRCELEIFVEHGRELVAPLQGQAVNIVDLGAGDGHKSAVLIEHLIELGVDVRYVPIDISEGALHVATESMSARFPDVEIAGILGEYFEGIRWLGEQSQRRNLVLFLGSNIGNFDRAQARGLLRELWMSMGADDLALIGFDLKKDIDKLMGAYNDREGVTAAFNLNLLRRINRELGGDFDLDKFRHYGTYNALSGAMESYLISLEAQTVRIEALQQSFAFEPWEPIHTEYSYKYLESDIEALASDTGFAPRSRFTDDNGMYCASLWGVAGTGAGR